MSDHRDETEVAEESATAPEPETMLGAPVTYSRGQKVLHPSRDQYLDLLWALRDDEHFELATDLCGVDYLTHGPRHDLPAGVAAARFEVVVELLSMSGAQRLRLRVQVPADDARMPSAYDVYPGLDMHERETFDMFGIEFEGHPDPNRILMPEDWDGHPLRKDHPTGKIPVQFKAPQGRA